MNRAATVVSLAVAALLTKYGAKSVTGINPALWPQVYADATAA